MTAITADDRGGCPDLAVLEAGQLTEAERSHVTRCDMCTLVVDVLAMGSGVSSGRIETGDCERFDALLAARADRTLNAAARVLLARHIATCEACRDVSQTMSPLDEESDHASLPAVDLANYEIGGEIGRGGMGVVLSARDLRIGRPVAIKELLPGSPHVARFEREARITARLQHPGIVPIYEIGTWPDGTPFYAMREVKGRELREEIETRSTLPKRLALLPSLLAACEAVAFAHSKGVIHRDLKPSNILVGEYGETVVIDWGLALDLAEGDELSPGNSERLTSAGEVVGTASYMAPEQAVGDPLDERADVYALGAILYHLLAGVAPYRGGTQRELVAQVRIGPPASRDADIPTDAPTDLVTVLDKAMSRESEKRYPSARELADDLQRFLTGRLVEAHHYSRGELVKRFIKRNRAAVTVTALATVILVAIGVVAVRRIIASSADARAQAKSATETARALLVEKGRIELLGGEPLRALAFLHEAKTKGETGADLEFLIGRAMTDLGSADRPLDCGSDDRHVDVSRDGSLLVAACHDRAKVWRVRAGDKEVAPTEIATLTGSSSGFDNLRFSHDGTRLATWGDDGIVRLWRVGDYAKPVELAHGTSTITMASFSDDDRILSTTGVDGYARIWDIESGARRVEIAPKIPIPKVGFALGQLAVRTHAGAKKTELLVLTPALGIGHRYDLEGNELDSFEIGSRVTNGDLSVDGRFAVACGRDSNPVVIDIASKKLHAELTGHTDFVWKCVFSADGTHVVTSSHDRTAKVWDITIAGSPKLIATANHGDFVWLSRFSPDRKRFFTVSPGKSIKVWDTASGGLLATYDSRGKDGRFLPDGRFAALRGDGRIDLWRAVSVRRASLDPPQNASIRTATPDGVVVTDGEDGLAIWDRSRRISTPALQAPLAVTRGRVAARTEGGVAVIDVATGSTTVLPIASPSEIQIAGDRVAIVSSDRTVEVWDVPTRKQLHARPDANRVVLDVAGKRVAVWHERESTRTPIVVWQVDGGARVATIDAIDARATAFALDGKRLVVLERKSASSEVASVFDLDTRARVMSAQPVESTPLLDPTGRWLTTIDSDHVVVVWNVDNGEKHAWFSGLPLQNAQANGTGTLLVAIEQYGRAVLVLSPRDGRILAHHAIAHDRAILMPTLDSFQAPRGFAWWTPDSEAFASIGKSFELWGASHAFTSQAIGNVIRKRVPWRIDRNGALERIHNGKISGRVTRDGVPVPGIKVEVQGRAPADMTDKAVGWESMKAKTVYRAPTTDQDGRFVAEGLELGELEYRVTASDGTRRIEKRTTATRLDDDEPLQIELQ